LSPQSKPCSLVAVPTVSPTAHPIAHTRIIIAIVFIVSLLGLGLGPIIVVRLALAGVRSLQ
jgi:hypothetical protein